CAPIPSASGNLIRKITDLCDSVQVKYRILPGIFAIIYGDAYVRQDGDHLVQRLACSATQVEYTTGFPKTGASQDSVNYVINVGEIPCRRGGTEEIN
ncbi:unnamed protein product, partial [marine sediment metagenome]